MLDFMRKKKNSWIIKAFFAVIVLTFVGFGVDMSQRRNSQDSIVAEVDGISIGSQEYAGLYNQQLAYYKGLFKDKMDDETLERLNIGQSVLDSLISKALILGEAKRNRLRVSDREVQDKILKTPNFHQDGVFDMEYYQAILIANRLTPEDYEAGVEEQLLIEKMRSKALSEVSVTDEDIRKEYLRQNRALSIYYFNLSSEDYLSRIDITDEEAKKFIEDYPEPYLNPAQVRVAYTYLDRAEFAASLKIGTEVLKAYYDDNIRRYYRPKEVSASHILIRPTPGAEDAVAAKADARKKTEELLRKINSGSDFAKLAEKHSEDHGSAKKGGELGFFGEGRMVKPFEEAAFGLKKGGVSGIVETEYGFHIIKADDIRGGTTKPFSEVKGEIRGVLTEERVSKDGRALMVEIHEIYNTTGSGAENIAKPKLKAESESRGLKFVETPLFAEGDNLAEGSEESLQRASFNLVSGSTSGIIETKGGFYVLKVLERVDEHMPPYEDVAEQVKGDMADERATEMAAETAEDILGEILAATVSFEDAAKGEGAEVKSSGFFKLSQGYVPEVGIYTADRPELFDISRDEPHYGSIVDMAGRYFLVKYKDSKEPLEEGLLKNREDTRRTLLDRLRTETEELWLEGLRSEADITVNPDYM